MLVSEYAVAYLTMKAAEQKSMTVSCRACDGCTQPYLWGAIHKIVFLAVGTAVMGLYGGIMAEKRKRRGRRERGRRGGRGRRIVKGKKTDMRDVGGGRGGGAQQREEDTAAPTIFKNDQVQLASWPGACAGTLPHVSLVLDLSCGQMTCSQRVLLCWPCPCLSPSESWGGGRGGEC